MSDTSPLLLFGEAARRESGVSRALRPGGSLSRALLRQPAPRLLPGIPVGPTGPCDGRWVSINGPAVRLRLLA
jgi:hypothetical protein